MALKPTDEQLDKLLAALGGAGGEVDTMLQKYGEATGLCRDTLTRWFVARKGDIAAAARDLKAHAEWRKVFMPSGTVDPATCADEIAQNKAFIIGYDNAGHPVTLLLATRHKPKGAEECKRFIAYSLDCSGRFGRMNANWDGKSVGIFDLRGMTMANYDVAALRAVFDLLQNHYPERLSKLYLYCAPLIFYGLWKLVSPFVDPVTKEKVVFVYEKEAAEIFSKDFAPEVLPPELGGTGELTTVPQVYEVIEKGLEHPNMARSKAAKAAAAAAAESAQPSGDGNGC